MRGVAVVGTGLTKWGVGTPISLRLSSIPDL